MGGSVGFWAANIGVLWASFEAFGGDVPFGVLVQGFFVGMAANLIPSPAGGVGSVDAGMIFAFDVLFGVPTAIVFPAVLTYRVIAFWLPIPPGVVAFFQLRVTAARWERERKDASTELGLRHYTSESKVMSVETKEIENVVIVGSGPAGYTAALYTSRADLDPLVVEGFAWGGLLQQTTDVENYPGYPEGVLGPEMMQQFRDQAERFGTRFITDDATKLELAAEPGGLHVVHVGGQEIRTRAVILAMGAEPKKLGVPGEEELAARGVSYCATCDAAFFRGARRSWSAAATPRWRTRPSSPSSPARSRSCTGATSSAPRRSCSTARATPTTSSS